MRIEFDTTEVRCNYTAKIETIVHKSDNIDDSVTVTIECEWEWNSEEIEIEVNEFWVKEEDSKASMFVMKTVTACDLAVLITNELNRR